MKNGDKIVCDCVRLFLIMRVAGALRARQEQEYEWAGSERVSECTVRACVDVYSHTCLPSACVCVCW